MKCTSLATNPVVMSKNIESTGGGVVKCVILATLVASLASLLFAGVAFAKPAIAAAPASAQHVQHATAPAAVKSGPREGSDGNNIVCNGVPSKSMLMYYVRGGTDSCGHHDIAAIWASQGITPQVASMMHLGTVCSSGGFSSTGRHHGPNSALDRPVRVGGTLFYVRPLAVWGSSCYSAWIGSTEDGRIVAILVGCGNTETTGSAPAPKPKSPTCVCKPKPTPKTGTLVVGKGTTNGSTATFRFWAENLSTHTKWYFRLRGGMSTSHSYMCGTWVRIHENGSKGWIKQLDRTVTVCGTTRVYILNKPVSIPSAPGPKVLCVSNGTTYYVGSPPAGYVNTDTAGNCVFQTISHSCDVAGSYWSDNFQACVVNNCGTVVVINGNGNTVTSGGNCNNTPTTTCTSNCTTTPPPPPPPPPAQPPTIVQWNNVEEATTNGEPITICATAQAKVGDTVKLTFTADFGSVPASPVTFTSSGTDQKCVTYIAPKDNTAAGQYDQIHYNVVDTTTGLQGQGKDSNKFLLKAAAGNPA
jgi:hypothetical protein